MLDSVESLLARGLTLTAPTKLQALIATAALSEADKSAWYWEHSASAYDITFAHNPKGESTSQHLMSVNGKFKDFLEEDLLEVADRFAIGTANSVISKVRDAIKAWPDFAGQAGLSKTLLEAIQQQHLLL